jgi:uncharacterized protein YxjI
MASPTPPPGWYPDPAGSQGTRWWDGQGWTDHVQPASPPPVQQSGGAPRSVLLEQPVLVVNQRTKLIELTNEYAVFDGNGQQLGAVVQVGQSTLRKAFRFVSQFDQFLTHRLEVMDATGPVLVLTRPAKVVRSRVQVARPDGTPVGIQAENWRAWDFSISDAAGREVARITKTWEGLARTVFTTADNYVVQVHQRLEEPLASLVLASALTVDTALKQDERGLN